MDRVNGCLLVATFCLGFAGTGSRMSVDPFIAIIGTIAIILAVGWR